MSAQDEKRELESGLSTSTTRRPQRNFFGPSNISNKEQGSSPNHLNNRNRRNSDQRPHPLDSEVKNGAVKIGSAPKKKFRQRVTSDQELNQDPQLTPLGNSTPLQTGSVPQTPVAVSDIQKGRMSYSNTTPRQQPNSVQRTRKITIFKPYLDEDRVQQGLQKSLFLKGVIRINQRKYEEAFINNPAGSDQADIAILGMPDRNRALHGDVVAVCVRPRAFWVVNEELYKDWKKGALQKTSAVENE
ncbi:unnamed protein product, partial [Strongylus vulgaris]